MHKSVRKLSRFVYFFLIILLASFSVAFFITSVERTELSLLKKYKVFFLYLFCLTVAVTAIVCATLKIKNSFYGRIIFIFLVFVFAFSQVLYCFTESGLIDKIDGVEDLREFISSFNGYSGILYVLLQFLQVVAIPIPSFITIGAGVLLFGPLKAALYSIVGITSGSLSAFFIAKYFGVKAIRWLIGEKNLNKGLKFLDGKNEIVLTFMFLFPFFPDDLLCFAAGLTKINPLFFTIMIFIVRTITVFASCYTLNNSIIPYDTPWGIALWIVVFLLVGISAIIIHKKGERIEKGVKNFFQK